jgi:multicomponent Na+:H+ antiporter subunit B
VSRRDFAALAILLVGLVFARLCGGYAEQHFLRPLAEYYLANGPKHLGAPNVITSVLITYRGFDTLGEVAVLMMVASSVGLILSKMRDEQKQGDKIERRPASELVESGAEVLLPFVFLFGAYVIMHGHLSAGGGFQGGAVVASGVMLLAVAKPGFHLPHGLLAVVESAAGASFVLIGILGIFLAGGFLDSRVLPLGQFGTMFSAGAIPVISVLLGIKVGAELSVIVDRFRV